MRKLPVLLVLSALLGIGTKTEAQFSYTFENVNQFFQSSGGGYYTGGVTATILFENINTYTDPEIIAVRSFVVAVSSRVRDFCDLYGLSEAVCVVGGSGAGTQGSVQTGTIPIGHGSSYIYDPFISVNSCAAYCFASGFDLNANLYGCQAPDFSDPVQYYGGRTCDADGFTGSLSLNVYFRYVATTDVPVFTFDATDLTARADNRVMSGPSAFVAPEPSSWLLTATGLGFVGALRRRKRATAAENAA